jgi:hypothetical protein
MRFTAEIADRRGKLKPGIAFPDNLAIIREALRDIAAKSGYSGDLR